MKLTLKHGHPTTDVSRFDTYSKGSLAMQLISYINNHVATAFEASQGSYTWHGAAN